MVVARICVAPARFGPLRAIYIWQSITMFLCPNDAIGTRGAPGTQLLV